MALDGNGHVHIAEASGRVRKVTVGTQAAALTLTLGGASPQRLLAQKGIAVTARVQQALLALRHRLGDDPRHAKVFGLTRASAKLAAAGTRTLTLRLPATAQKRFRQLWKPGQQARSRSR